MPCVESFCCGSDHAVRREDICDRNELDRLFRLASQTWEYEVGVLNPNLAHHEYLRSRFLSWWEDPEIPDFLRQHAEGWWISGQCGVTIVHDPVKWGWVALGHGMGQSWYIASELLQEPPPETHTQETWATLGDMEFLRNFRRDDRECEGPRPDDLTDPAPAMPMVQQFAEYDAHLAWVAENRGYWKPPEGS